MVQDTGDHAFSDLSTAILCNVQMDASIVGGRLLEVAQVSRSPKWLLLAVPRIACRVELSVGGATTVPTAPRLASLPAHLQESRGPPG